MSKMSAMLQGPVYYKAAVIASSPLFLIPVWVLVKSLLGYYGDEDGNDWGFLFVIFSVVYCLPAIGATIVLLAISRFFESQAKQTYAVTAALLAVVAATAGSIWLAPWLVFGGDAG